MIRYSFWLQVRRALPVLSLAILAGCPSPTTTPPAAPARPVAKDTVKPALPAVADAELPAEVTYNGGFAQLNYAQAVTLSKRDKLPMLLYFYTPWCGPCKELENKAFPDAALQQLVHSMVGIKVDAGDDAQKTVAERYGVHSYPTMIVCRPGGEEIERFFGFCEPAEFVGTVNDYLAGRNTATDYRERALADPENLELAFTAGRELAIRKRGNEAIPFLERVWRADQENRTNKVPQAMLLHAKTVYLDQLNEEEKALPILEELSERFPTTYHGVEATYMIARVYLEQKRPEDARKVLLERVTLDPKKPISYHRFGSFCLRYRVFLDEAVAKLEEGLEANPSEGYLWKALADLKFRNKDYAGAVAAMEQAVATTRHAKETYEKLLNTYRKAMERETEGR